MHTRGAFWDTNDPYLYMRFDQGENGCSVVIGGEDHKTGQERDTEVVMTGWRRP